MNKIKFCLALMLVTPFLASAAQEKPVDKKAFKPINGAAPVVETVKKKPGRTEPFPSLEDTITSGFEGNDIAAVYSSIQGALREGGAINDGYISREKYAALSAPIIEKLNSGYHIFKIDGRGSSYFRYNPEAEQFTISIYPEHSYGASRDGRNSIDILSEQKEIGAYSASNALGVKVDVTKAEETRYKISYGENAISKELRSKFNSVGMIVFKVPMSPDVARESSKSISIAIVCKLKTPPLRSESDYSEPTINHPREVVINKKIIDVEVVDAIVYDKATGKRYSYF